MADVRTQIVEYARSKIGDPYRWGATGPDAFDCSGLIYAAYKAAGLDVKRTTAANIGKEGAAVDLAQAQPGDVVYFDEPGAVDHVGIYIGNGQMIDAPTEGKPVGVHSISGYTSIRQFPQVRLAGDSGGLSVITDPVGSAMNVVGDAVSTTFGAWQSDLTSIGLKVLAGVAAAALVIAGAWTAVHDGDDG